MGARVIMPEPEQCQTMYSQYQHQHHQLRGRRQPEDPRRTDGGHVHARECHATRERAGIVENGEEHKHFAALGGLHQFGDHRLQDGRGHRSQDRDGAARVEPGIRFGDGAQGPAKQVGGAADHGDDLVVVWIVRFFNWFWT